MFGIIGWIVFGLVIGILAKLLMPGRDPGGFIITVLLGIAGAVVGGFAGRALGFYGPGEAAGFLMSLLGAVILLFVYHKLRRPTAVPHPGRLAGAHEVVLHPLGDRADQILRGSQLRQRQHTEPLTGSASPKGCQVSAVSMACR